jgi:hypothetical protein
MIEEQRDRAEPRVEVPVRIHRRCAFCRRIGGDLPGDGAGEGGAPDRPVDGTVDDDGFRSRFLGPRVPVLFPGIAGGSAAVATWTPETLARRAGDTVVHPSDGTTTTLGEYVERLSSGQPDLPIVANEWLRRMGGGLAADFEIPKPFRRNWLALDLLRPFRHPEWDWWVEFFLGPPGGRFPNVHLDGFMTHAWSVQVHGSKRFYFWPPWPGQPLLPALSVEDLRRANETRTMSHARTVTVDLRPGDALYVPAGWWHTTEILSTSITLGGNFVDDSNWCDFLTSLRMWSRASGWGPHRTAGLAAAHVASPLVGRRARARLERPSGSRWAARPVVVPA